jgi:hypothetical protein
MGRQDLQATPPHFLHTWWKRLWRIIDRGHMRTFDDLILYFWWNVWKERNRRVFQSASKGIEEVATLIKIDVELFNTMTSRKNTQVGLAPQRMGSY